MFENRYVLRYAGVLSPSPHCREDRRECFPTCGQPIGYDGRYGLFGVSPDEPVGF